MHVSHNALEIVLFIYTYTNKGEKNHLECEEKSVKLQRKRIVM
jgi:hypothetical protein